MKEAWLPQIAARTALLPPAGSELSRLPESRRAEPMASPFLTPNPGFNGNRRFPSNPSVSCLREVEDAARAR